MAETKQKAHRKTEKKDGRVSQVIGAVVDVTFPPGEQPELYEALEVHTAEGRTIVLEVQGDLDAQYVHRPGPA